MSVDDGKAALQFHHDKPELRIELQVMADRYLSKQITIANLGDKPVVVFDIVLERFRLLQGTSLEGGGRGKPALIGDTGFATIEFPESYALVDGEMLSLEYYPAVTLRPGEVYASERALLGIVGNLPADTLLEFIRSHYPQAKRRFGGYYSTRGAHELEGPRLQVIAEQAQHAIDLKRNWRIPTQYFIIDLADLPPTLLGDEERFPADSFDQIRGQLRVSGIKLGLSTAAKYANLLEEVVRQWDIGLLIIRATETRDKYDQFKATSGILKVIEALKSASPEIVIEVSGFAESPWWLKHADAVIRPDNRLADEPAPSLRDSQIFQADLQHELFVADEGTQICHSDCSFWLGKVLWRKSAIMSVMRTGRLFLSGELQILDEDDKLFLQRVVQVRNAYSKSIGVVQNVLGSPAKREVYGYASVADGRGLVAVLNPSWEPKTVSVKAQDFYCNPDHRNVCIQLFPHTEAWAMLPGGDFHLHINPWEVRWFEVAPSQEHVELLESRTRRVENRSIPVTEVALPDDAQPEVTTELEYVRFASGCMHRCWQTIPREWEAFPIYVDLKGLAGSLYVNNSLYNTGRDTDFLMLYPWTEGYGRLQFGRENLFYLANRENDDPSGGKLVVKPVPYFSSSACREDWPHPGDCCMVVIIRYLKQGEPLRLSEYPEVAQCAVWLDGTWMEPYRVPPLVPRIRSGFSWAVFMLDLEGDWECVRILIPKIADCDYDVSFFLTDRLKASSYARTD